MEPMAENSEQPEDTEDISLEHLSRLLPDEPSALHELAVHTHELYVELKSVGFPSRALNQIIASMLSDVVTGRIFDDIEDDEDWEDIDEGDFDNDGEDPQ